MYAKFPCWIALFICCSLFLQSQFCGAREWSDTTGTFKVEAELVSNTAGKVTLRKSNGQEIVVPVEKLSAADQKHLADLAKASRPAVPMPVKPVAKPPEDSPAGQTGMRVGRLLVEQAMAKKVSLKAEKVPLHEVVSRLKKLAGVYIVCDSDHLEDEGIRISAPVDIAVELQPLREVLAKLLKPVELVPVIRDEVIYLTTKKGSRDGSLMEVRVYQLLERNMDTDTLIEGITSKVDPNSWSDVGGPGDIQVIYPRLIINQFDDLHTQIETQFARKLRRIGGDRKPSAPLLREFALCQRALAAPAKDFNFQNNTLSEIAAQISKAQGIEVTLDPDRLKDHGVTPDQQMTLQVSGVRLQLALTLLLEPHGLSFLPTPKGLQITGAEAAGKLFSTKQNMADLIPPPQGDTDPYIEVITSCIEPDRWKEVGGPGRIEIEQSNSQMTIEQSFAVHLKVQQLLNDLREKVKR